MDPADVPYDPPTYVPPFWPPPAVPPPRRHPQWDYSPLVFQLSPAARFINEAHVPIDREVSNYLSTLQQASLFDPRNDPALSVDLELAFGPSGELAAETLLQSSGFEDFDREMMAAVHRAAPFPIPRPDLCSPDGNFYVQWSLHRDPKFACSVMNARPRKYELIRHGSRAR